MSPAPKRNQSSPARETFYSGPEAPTKPGIYWFRDEASLLERMVEVSLTTGNLTVWWRNQERSVTKLKGHWRGPIPQGQKSDT
jgi:hypothetical protein